MTRKRRGQAGGSPGGDQPPMEPIAFLIARAMEDERSRKKKSGIRLRFKIRHIMWLSVWTALVLAARDPLIASLPEAAGVIAWISGSLAIAMVIALYGVALLMDEGETKDTAVLIMLYCLAGDLFLFLVFLVLDARK
jgi:hypothetical protein